MSDEPMISKRELLLAVPALALAACGSAERAGTLEGGGNGATTTLVVNYLPTPRTWRR